MKIPLLMEFLTSGDLTFCAPLHQSQDYADSGIMLLVHFCIAAEINRPQAWLTSLTAVSVKTVRKLLHLFQEHARLVTEMVSVYTVA